MGSRKIDKYGKSVSFVENFHTFVFYIENNLASAMKAGQIFDLILI